MADIPVLDAARMGANLFRCKSSMENGCFTVTHRTWMYALSFACLAVLPLIVIVQGNVGFAGAGSLLYLGTALLAFVALLYALYGERISFRFASRRCSIKKGFFGFRQTIEMPFDDIEAVTIRKTSHGQGPTPVTTTARPPMIVWDIGLTCKDMGPTFDFWQSCNLEAARYIASVLAASLGCRIEEIGLN